MGTYRLLLSCLWTTYLVVLVCGRGVHDRRHSRHQRQVQVVDNYNAEYRYYSMYQMQADYAPDWQGSGRPGESSDTHSCQHIRKVPRRLRKPDHMAPRGLTKFYVKYTEAYGIPVLGSSDIPDDALRRACYVTRFVFADRRDVRMTYYKMYGRVALIGEKEFTTQIPEYQDLDDWWNQRARGLGATRERPVSTAAEENVLCYSNDRYYNEDILLHEVAHGVHILGAAYVIPDFYHRLRALYDQAKAEGLWQDTYAMTTDHEYFAEGVQSYFNNNAFSDPPNGIHNMVDTREKLQHYDPGLYYLLEEVFPCKNNFIHRCAQDRHTELEYPVRINCHTGSSSSAEGQYPEQLSWTDQADENSVYYREQGDDKPQKNHVEYNIHIEDQQPQPECTDMDGRCQSWAQDGWCTRCSDYMVEYCKVSCGQCLHMNLQPEHIDCEDQSEYCPAWASVGECQRSPEYMVEYCKYSCRLC